MNTIRNKKGFTVVELVVVIAVIAILAAVLIPTFAALVKKANISVDIQLAANLNRVLAMCEATDGKNITMHDAVLDLAENGFDMTKISSSDPDNVLLWDQTADRYAVYSVSEDKLIWTDADNAGIKEITAANKSQFWKTFKAGETVSANGFSAYWADTELPELPAKDSNNGYAAFSGLDLGYCSEFYTAKTIEYDGKNGDNIFRGNFGSVYALSYSSHLHLYGITKSLNINIAGEEAVLCIHGSIGTIQKNNAADVTKGTVVADGAKFHQKRDDVVNAIGEDHFNEKNAEYGVHCIVDGKCIFCPDNQQPGTEHTEHTLDDGTVLKAANCTEDGVKLYKCTYEGCDYAKAETIPALGHDWEIKQAAVAATCKADGHTEVKKCKRCDAEDNGRLIPSLPHKWDNGHCSVCDQTLQLCKIGSNWKDVAINDEYIQNNILYLQLTDDINCDVDKFVKKFAVEKTVRFEYKYNNETHLWEIAPQDYTYSEVARIDIDLNGHSITFAGKEHASGFAVGEYGLLNIHDSKYTGNTKSTVKINASGETFYGAYFIAQGSSAEILIENVNIVSNICIASGYDQHYTMYNTEYVFKYNAIEFKNVDINIPQGTNYVSAVSKRGNANANEMKVTTKFDLDTTSLDGITVKIDDYTKSHITYSK